MLGLLCVTGCEGSRRILSFKKYSGYFGRICHQIVNKTKLWIMISFVLLTFWLLIFLSIDVDHEWEGSLHTESFIPA